MIVDEPLRLLPNKHKWSGQEDVIQFAMHILPDYIIQYFSLFPYLPI